MQQTKKGSITPAQGNTIDNKTAKKGSEIEIKTEIVGFKNLTDYKLTVEQALKIYDYLDNVRHMVQGEVYALKKDKVRLRKTLDDNAGDAQEVTHEEDL